MSEDQINEWTVDFSQAKIALKNLEVLVTALTQGQADVVTKLKILFEKYIAFIGEDASAQKREAMTEQVRVFERIAGNMHMTTTKFASRANAQLDSARTQVNQLYHTLGKVRTQKTPQHVEAAQQLGHQVPEFLNLFDAFLARFTLEVRWQQADFYKQLGDAFTHAGRPEPVKSVVQSWITEYDQIMPAVEALKSVRPQPGHAHHPGTAHEPVKVQTEKVDSVLFTPVKWIHSKFTRDLKDFRFSDPRRGFFNKPTHPPKSDREFVRAVFDFSSETDSDLKFKKGDLITLVDKGTADDPNWWCGELNGERGLFPRNYVEEAPHSHSEEHAERDPDEYVPRVAPEEDTAKDANVGEPASQETEEEHPPTRPPRPTKSAAASPSSKEPKDHLGDVAAASEATGLGIQGTEAGDKDASGLALATSPSDLTAPSTTPASPTSDTPATPLSPTALATGSPVAPRGESSAPGSPKTPERPRHALDADHYDGEHHVTEHHDGTGLLDSYASDNDDETSAPKPSNSAEEARTLESPRASEQSPSSARSKTSQTLHLDTAAGSPPQHHPTEPRTPTSPLAHSSLVDSASPPLPARKPRTASAVQSPTVQSPTVQSPVDKGRFSQPTSPVHGEPSNATDVAGPELAAPELATPELTTPASPKVAAPDAEQQHKPQAQTSEPTEADELL